MKTAKEIRQQFLDFFESKGHEIVASAPVVNQNDPTLMFINSGMAQFKDYFLGHQQAANARVADTQKCLRVSGKHNDLEDVGKDSYHQTLFEMLGNWSFGDYFKEEAIEWAWELLTEVYGIDKDRLYITVFEGDKEDKLPADTEAEELWQKWISKDRIMRFDKKDNFWEMGEQGPCGPCSEIHVDLRSDEDRATVDGKSLVNMDHPEVIEIWNLVFMQYNRKADKSLEELSAKHIDTGMGLERLCMVLQHKKTNYSTDLFSPIIAKIEEFSGFKYKDLYGDEHKTDIAMRVIVDHVRAVALVIADGQLPSNTGAGYVVRRVLRRAVRYYYSFLDRKDPMIYQLISTVSDMFAEVFPELKAQEAFITKIVKSEEESFLRTLANGLKRIDSLEIKEGVLDGKTAFELFDTYGFPLDLTMLIGTEKGWTVDEEGFKLELQKQKERSQQDAAKDVDDWVELISNSEVNFVGYDEDQSTTRLLKYRKVVVKKKEQFHLVLEQTPFYPEGGGQVGDTGLLWFGEEKIPVIDTRKENDLVISISTKLPKNIDSTVKAEINVNRRRSTENNHSATHLLHAALREVLGDHVQQKGSLVNADLLRFDFSHFEKMTEEQIDTVEALVNQKIRANIPLKEQRALPIEQAKEEGAMMLFGEKYSDEVRVITFDDAYSKELCGGCHVDATGQIGMLIIREETSVAAGVRRVVALTAQAAEDYLRKERAELAEVRQRFNNPKKLVKVIDKLLDDQKELQKTIDQMLLQQAQAEKIALIDAAETVGGILLVSGIIGVSDSNAIKQLCNEITQLHSNAVVIIGAAAGKKASLTIHMERELAEKTGINAGKIIREAAKLMKGGGGGQPFFATAGGKDPEGLEAAIAKAKELVLA